MKDREFKIYWLTVLLIVFAVSFYPLYMGVRVLSDMIAQGTVMKENYPKYIIPYTPIAGAVILGVLLLPLFLRLFLRRALLGGGALALGAFFGLEILLEKNVVVTTAETVSKLEDWQMFMCYQPPGGWGTTTEYKTHTAVEILMGEYNPMFKLHFYLISVVLILAILNSVYGFAQIVKTGNSARKKALILQSIAAGTFLALCILACFTAFWRDGSIQVSPLSATLMCVFFILLGVTVGIFLGSLLLGKRRALARLLPAVAASATTLLMYVGEMILLHGHLYRFGVGFFFDGLPAIVLAPADIAVILAAGLVTAILMRIVSGPRKEG